MGIRRKKVFKAGEDEEGGLGRGKVGRVAKETRKL